MWKSIHYKEWIKTRWFVILYAFLGVGFIAYLFLIVNRNFKFTDSSSYWYNIVFMGVNYFSSLKYIPIVGAVTIAVAQYIPEIVNKRIKLSFHLPMNENRVLLLMMLYGTFCLFSVYVIQFIVFWALSFIYFPSDIYLPALVSILPWFMVGFAMYYLTALIILEPVWKYRLAYLVVVAAFIPMFFQSDAAGAYGPANAGLAILVAISSISLLFSGYRFRKGEM